MNKDKKKAKTLSLRCTVKEYKYLLQESKKLNQTITDFLLDRRIEGRRFRKKDKRILTATVQLQQLLNELKIHMQNNKITDENIKKQMDEIMKGVERLWDI